MSWRINHPSTLVSRWFYGGPNALDSTGRYDGTLVNTPTWSTTAPKNNLSAIELDGNNQYVNLGDVTQLNAIEQFTICFWMNQDVLDQDDMMAIKVAGINYIQFNTRVDGSCRAYITVGGVVAYGWFDYSTVISALNWHHMAIVFDGSQTGNANRLLVYVDANPMTLAFVGAAIPAISPDMSGGTLLIGNASDSFDGRLWDWRIHSVALSRDEINRIIHAPAARV